ncbi:SDR family oxidoreductase [Aeoliella sp. ICT_H6.2]|uniref:SDR family oxidoreductase n=1 Tax=Aeoliella straminimaris TaxID=2954799 RepID=A0A9X2JIH0_9BACT|nr:SDR family oxidoreductase [Aeoliella straminimaris]MCO6046826.1 SDR family oxidoreductase [Aeoliella straminimaris]
MPHSALIFGCGYVGKRVAEFLREAGAQVHAVTRSSATADEFAAVGFQPLVADVTDPATLNNLPTVDTVLFAVGYDRSSDQSIDEVCTGGVKNVLNALPEKTGRFLYISTTGVYGDAGGEWIDEETRPNPSRAGGIASLAAEELIRASKFADRAAILRLAGIYGPNRLPYLKKLQAAEPIEAPQAGYLNLIHVHDAARITMALAEPAHEIQGPVTYCVSDGHPVVRGEYYREAARLLGAPAPTFAAPPAESPRAARAAADKRVSNRRVLEAVGIELSYPTYKEGLASIVRCY